MVINDNREFNHVGALQLDGINKTDDVALALRGGCKIKNEEGVNGIKQLNAKVGHKVVTFINDNYRIQIRKNLHQ